VRNLVSRYEASVEERNIINDYKAGKISASEAATRLTNLASNYTGDLQADLLSSAAQFKINDTELRVNMMYNAWKYGAKFEGKFVTDSMLLKAIGDAELLYPENDARRLQWTSFKSQIRFQIDESITLTKFAQGKISAGAVAGFYKGELSKFAPDSEMYREIARRAAEWGKSAASQAAGAAAKARRDRAEKAIAALTAPYADALQVTQKLVELGQKWGALPTAFPTTPGRENARDLQPYQTQHERTMVGLAQEVLPGGWDAYVSLLVNAHKGLVEAYNMALKAGLPESRLNDIAKMIADSWLNIQQAKTMPIRAKYEAIRSTFDAAVAAANGNPIAEARALRQYENGLTQLLGEAQTAEGIDPAIIGAMRTELSIVQGNGIPENAMTVFRMYGGPEDDPKYLSKVVSDVALHAQKILNGEEALYWDSKQRTWATIEVGPQGAPVKPGVDPFFGPSGNPLLMAGNLVAYGDTSPIYAIGAGSLADVERYYSLAQSKTIVDENGKERKLSNEELLALKNSVTKIGYVIDTPNGKIWAITDPASGQTLYFDRNPFDIYAVQAPPELRGFGDLIVGSSMFLNVAENGPEFYVPIAPAKDEVAGFGAPNLGAVKLLSGLGTTLPFAPGTLLETKLKLTELAIQDELSRQTGASQSPRLLRLMAERDMFAESIKAENEVRPTVVGGQVVTRAPNGDVLRADFQAKKREILAERAARAKEPERPRIEVPRGVRLPPGVLGEAATTGRPLGELALALSPKAPAGPGIPQPGLAPTVGQMPSLPPLAGPPAAISTPSAPPIVPGYQDLGQRGTIAPPKISPPKVTTSSSSSYLAQLARVGETSGSSQQAMLDLQYYAGLANKTSSGSISGYGSRLI
jgi:hypothetical protein